jgi:hypothetical protein
MAEIKVEKKRSSALPWIIGLLLLGLLLWGVSRMMSNDRTDTTDRTTTGALAPSAPSTLTAAQQQITVWDGVRAA